MMMTDEEKEALNEELLKAADEGRLEDVSKLLEKGADVNAKDDYGWTALMLACENRDMDMFGELASRKDIDFKAKDMTGKTAFDHDKSGAFQGIMNFQLVEMSRAGDLDEVSRLIENGISANAKNAAGVTALMGACENGHTDVARLLLEKGADIKAKDENGNTAFDYDKSGTLQGIMNEELLKACKEGRFDDVPKWLEKGADVNARAEDGSTPLMWVVMEGDVKTAKLLIQKGADVNAKDKTGENAFDYAQDKAIVDVLKEGQTKYAPSHLKESLSDLAEKGKGETASPTLTEEYTRGNDISVTVTNEALRNRGR